MPSFEHHGAHIYYEEFGQGFPILTFAPAGLQSVIAVWSQPSAPINPTTEFADKLPRHRDGSAQRRRPVARPDHRAGRLGQLHRRPHRAARPSAHRSLPSLRSVHRRVVHPEPDQGSARARPERRAGAADRPRRRRWRPAAPPGSTPGRKRSRTTRRPPRRCSTRSAGTSTRPALSIASTAPSSRQVRTPCLVLAGNDEAHPYPISEELSKLLPNCEFIAEWKTGAALTSARARVKEFLAKHTPR